MRCIFVNRPCLLKKIDLKPENLLFRTEAEDSEIMVADFGLSRVIEEEKLTLLTEMCGTPGVSNILLLLCKSVPGRSDVLRAISGALGVWLPKMGHPCDSSGINVL